MVVTEKKLLCEVYKLQVSKGIATFKDILKNLDCSEEELNDIIKRCSDSNLIALRDEMIALSSTGRKKIKVVFTGGAFEVLHYGHLYTLENAKKFGDVLVVVIATDKTFVKRKGRAPIVPEELRQRLVSSVRFVDVAIVGSEINIYNTLEKIKPDIVVLGYDQAHNELEIMREAKKRGMQLKVIRLDSPYPQIKTSKILREI